MVCVVPKQAAFVVAFALTSAAASGTHPFTFGHVFKQGQVPSSIVADVPNHRVTVLRRWPDGSVAHAQITVRVPLTQNAPKTITLSAGAGLSGGTPLTSSDIQAAAPSASAAVAGVGTVDLSSLLATPFENWYSTPELAMSIYRADLGGGSVWFHVWLWADGRMWVRCSIENCCWLDNGAGALATDSTQTGVPTITINGTVVYNNGGASLTHYAKTGYDASGWIGTDPQITPSFDWEYIRATKYVPNHDTPPASGVLSSLDTIYLQLDRGPFTADMGSVAYHPEIGLVPDWNAALIASGDSRAYKATLVAAQSIRSYPICWRSKTTKKAVRPSDFGTWTAYGTSGAGGFPASDPDAGSLSWDSAHFPNEGFLAYMVTADPFHYDTMELIAATIYLGLQSARGNGVNRYFDNNQTRGRAWMLRSIGCYVAIAPDAELAAGKIAADYRTLLANNYAVDQATISSGLSMVPLGSLYQGAYSGWPTASSGGANVVGSITGWMTPFLDAVNGWLSEMPTLSNMTALIQVRDASYPFIVGLFGRVGFAGEFPFIYAANYGIKVSTGSPFDQNWYPDWGAIFQASFGVSPTTISGNALLDGNFPNMNSYWGNLMPALAYAKDHGAPGAAAAYDRLINASNYSTLYADFQNYPVWAVRPRS